jgi:hypothetical protein
MKLADLLALVAGWHVRTATLVRLDLTNVLA